MPRVRSFKNTRQCPYKNCKLYCETEYAHRARYSYINRNWRKKVEKLDQEIQEKPSHKINWNLLKKLGVLYNIPNGSQEIDYEKLTSLDPNLKTAETEQNNECSQKQV